MKQRLNLTIDRKVLHRAKLYARRNNKSISALVDAYLQGLTGEEPTHTGTQPCFSSQWSGAFTLSDTPEDTRMQALKQKYGL